MDKDNDALLSDVIDAGIWIIIDSDTDNFVEYSNYRSNFFGSPTIVKRIFQRGYRVQPKNEDLKLTVTTALLKRA